MQPTPMSHLPSATPPTDLFRPIVRGAAQAITDFAMIEDGDRIMVCLSGGKDSYTLLDVLLHFQRRAPIRFELVAVNLDQGQPGFPKHVLPEYLSALGVEFSILERDTFSTVMEKTKPGQTTCTMCSRLRRGHLYAHARHLGASKIALGHHREDLLETLFMNMFFGARLKAMAPRLTSDDGGNVVIRPLAYVAEADIQRYADARAFPIIPCTLCGSQPNLQRVVVGEMLAGWEREHPGRLNNILRSLSRVTPSHLLDRDLFDFAGAGAESDTASDSDAFAERELLVGLEELVMVDG
ncbi:tRNA 2-thiocytidine(32) synthetase TtcA [Deinococcus marmoris]|uniref:tRNA 2-thiocytidine(32) synthetase TtcA n=1 Tax=Deinococcus marmoris TaxID=249408 RepID=UPI000ADD822D|nr:tRNA 2-thiocytidine(32) synthetase TtcA [Deinococcus marmoris]